MPGGFAQMVTGTTAAVGSGVSGYQSQQVAHATIGDEHKGRQRPAYVQNVAKGS